MAQKPPPVTVRVPPDRVVADPEKLRWGTVSTVRAPLRDIARFAAYHLDLGAARVDLYLDSADPNVATFFAAHEAVQVTRCDDAYWEGKPEQARATHQMRQAHNATCSYRASRLDWLAHIDVDEFLLAPRPIAQLLAEVPPDAAYARMRPAEMLAQPDPWDGPAYFKLTRRERRLRKAVLEEIYPEFGAHVPEGFLSYSGGKNFARTGLPDFRLGIHALWQKGRPVGNGHWLPELHVGHAHAPSWEAFEQHFRFRRTHGSYRKRDSKGMHLQDVLDVILEAEGAPGLRRFFDEMCAATPARLAALAAHDMLLEARLDLDEKVARWFGALPAAE